MTDAGPCLTSINEECGEWTCTECGFTNKIDKSEIFQSEDEYQAAMRDPYKGLTDGQILAKKTLRQIKKLLMDIDRNGYKGIGHPEPPFFTALVGTQIKGEM